MMYYQTQESTYTATRNGVEYESKRPVDVLLQARFPENIILDGFRIVWQHFGLKALIQAARVELFHYAYLFPVEIHKDVMEFLRHGNVVGYCMGETEKTKSDIDEILHHAVWGYFYNSAVSIIRAFNVKPRDNSALDMHFRACKLYLTEEHYLLSGPDMINFYNYLEGNPIQDYWMRVVLDDHRHAKYLTTKGFKLKPHLGVD